jgi:hypothetical protein
MGGIFELCCGGKDPVYTEIEEAALGAYDTISKVDIIALKGSDFGDYERNDIIKSVVDVKRTLVWVQRCVTSPTNDQLPSVEEAHELKEIFDEFKVYSALMDVANTNSNDKLNEALMTINNALTDFMLPKNWWLYGALPKWGELPDWNELKPKLLDELGNDLVRVLQG